LGFLFPKALNMFSYPAPIRQYLEAAVHVSSSR